MWSTWNKCNTWDNPRQEESFRRDAAPADALGPMLFGYSDLDLRRPRHAVRAAVISIPPDVEPIRAGVHRAFEKDHVRHHAIFLPFHFRLHERPLRPRDQTRRIVRVEQRPG